MTTCTQIVYTTKNPDNESDTQLPFARGVQQKVHKPTTTTAKNPDNESDTQLPFARGVQQKVHKRKG